MSAPISLTFQPMTGRRLKERIVDESLGRESADTTPRLTDERPSDRSAPPSARAASGSFPRTLIVTGHLAPGRGGVESFTAEITRRLPLDRITVMAPQAPATDAVDRTLPFEVVRYPGRLATHPGLARRISHDARALGIDAAWITSAMPLGALAGPLRRYGVGRIVTSTHGMEVGWARVPGVRRLMIRAARQADVVTYLGDYTGKRLAGLVRAPTEMVRLTGGVDPDRFEANDEHDELREDLGLGNYQVVVSASRLVRRKGQDVLIAAWPSILARHPRARLVIVGDGPRRAHLERLAQSVGVAPWVWFVGSVSDAELAGYLACGDVFALPCRDVWGGLEVEGLGLSILEASACGLPVVVGASGGSRDAVIDGVTGAVIDGRSRQEVSDAICHLLSHPTLARQVGTAGRAWVCQRWGWDRLARQLQDAIAGSSVAAPVTPPAALAPTG
jgi:phosphatidyl-myo-inositol dimannoside synthase